MPAAGRWRLEELADLPFVGMYCVEVSPPYDHAELTSYAAANFGWTYLCGQLSKAATTLRSPYSSPYTTRLD